MRCGCHLAKYPLTRVSVAGISALPVRSVTQLPGDAILKGSMEDW